MAERPQDVPDSPGIDKTSQNFLIGYSFGYKHGLTDALDNDVQKKAAQRYLAAAALAGIIIGFIACRLIA